MIQTLLIVIAINVLIFIFLYFLQRRLLYFPLGIAATPQAADVPDMQVVELKTCDNVQLMAWYRTPILASKPTIIYFHGNAGNIADRAFLVKPYLTAGYGVLLVTYRGYSQNPGKPTQEGLYNDARAAIAFLEKQKVSHKHMVLYGESLGSAVAIQMASEYQDIGAIVLQSPFTSFIDVGRFHYPFLPVKWVIKDKFATLASAKRVHAPVFVIYAKGDLIIPSKLSKRVYNALPEPKELLAISNKGHNDLFEPKEVLCFIDKYVTVT